MNRYIKTDDLQANYAEAPLELAAWPMADPAAEALDEGVPGECLETTLIELVRAVDSVADTEEEVIATVISLLASGQVRLGRRPLPDAA